MPEQHTEIAIAFARDQVIKESFRKQMEQATNLLLQDELTAFLGYEAFHRPGSVSNYRNGFYPRQLWKRFGWLNLRVPRDRAGRFEAHTFNRDYERNHDLEALVLELRREDVKQVEINHRLKQLYGPYYETPTVTTITKAVNQHHNILQNRRQNYRYSGVYQQTLPVLVADKSAARYTVNVKIKSCVDSDDEVFSYNLITSYRSPALKL
ncbi:transposase [Lapidilactobacillus gannanensis]|uniref:Mutator family transposase n=1 Tax=Lapidilactobacillus gannanensis TaxID=2486002 RepID=A0ABW4BIY2_9LACO|nr:transposase [Lapidilactobacillus gannanensis]